MVITPVLRQLQMDNTSLWDYSSGIIPSFADIKRRLYLNERMQNVYLPDHYYYNARDYSLGEINTVQDLITKGLPGMAVKHLEIAKYDVHVRIDAFNEWQKLMTLCSPLLCVSALLWRGVFLKGNRDKLYLISFMISYIEKNCRFTSIPSPNFPQMDALLNNSGFSDLHIHLNGSTETDEVWQKFLRYPKLAYKEVKSEFKSSGSARYDKIKEQFEQEDQFLTPKEFYLRLIAAQRVRRFIVHRLFRGKLTPELNIWFDKGFPFTDIMKLKSFRHAYIPESTRHPLSSILDDTAIKYSTEKDLCLEALLYILTIDEISVSQDEELAELFHYYILLLGFINRFLVQQITQVGFDQFQKITLNGFRNHVEKKYERRFCQLHGNGFNKLNVLEGRFSPAGSPADNDILIKNIVKAFEKLKKNSKSEGKNHFHLKLVAHFIKTKDSEKVTDSPNIVLRHRNLRENLWKKANALAAVLHLKRFREYIVGIDAASNELDAPPEVFASVYRFMRKKGVRHFTYHAGEDYHHLIGGLRAIYEAVIFLDLQYGDRIGHGTAAGIDPALWLNSINGKLYISKGEWLDDLVFAHHIISESKSVSLHALLPHLKTRIEELAEQIYGKYCSLYTITQAWLLRKYNPIYFLYDYSYSSRKKTFWKDEWMEVKSKTYSKDTTDILTCYHKAHNRVKYNEVIMIEPAEIIGTAENFELLQNLLLKELHEREIILEVLPTSNVRISFYRDYDEHHLWRWLGIKDKPGQKNSCPPVVIGTDDPGIFATNIYNEYCHIYKYLVDESGKSHSESVGIIKEIIANSKVYGFN